MPNYFKIGQGNQWLRPASATCDFRILHGTANSARCTSPAVLPWSPLTIEPIKIYLNVSVHFSWNQLVLIVCRFFENCFLKKKTKKSPACSLLEWCFIISIDTCRDWFQRTYVLIIAQKNL